MINIRFHFRSPGFCFILTIQGKTQLRPEINANPFPNIEFSQNRNIQIIHAGPRLHTPGLSFISLTRIDQLRLQTEKIIKFKLGKSSQMETKLTLVQIVTDTCHVKPELRTKIEFRPG